MNPYDNNPWATDTARDTRSEYVANQELWPLAQGFKQALRNDGYSKQSTQVILNKLVHGNTWRKASK